MEKVIDCPVCFDTDHCFEEMQKEFSSFMCFKCGYNSNTTFKYESNELKTAQLGATQLMNDVCFYDEDREIMWFPSIVNMGELGMIYPEGTSTNYLWKYAKIVDIPKEEQAVYDNYNQRLDVENAETFGQYEFMKACKLMGITQDIK